MRHTMSDVTTESLTLLSGITHSFPALRASLLCADLAACLALPYTFTFGTFTFDPWPEGLRHVQLADVCVGFVGYVSHLSASKAPKCLGLEQRGPKPTGKDEIRGRPGDAA